MRNLFGKKGLLTVLFGLIIAFIICETPGQAAENGQQRVFSGDKVTAKVNEEVELPIYLTSNGEVSAGQVKFIYDKKALELTKISAGADLNGFSLFKSVENGKALFGNLSGKTIPTGTVEVLIATFKINANAELKTYGIKLQDVAFSSSEAKKITDLFTITHGNITVQDNQSQGGGSDTGSDNGNGDGGTTPTPEPKPELEPPSSGGGGSTPTPSKPTTEQIIVDVDGEDGSNLTKTPITRTTEPNGTVKDKVTMSEGIAKDTVTKAKEKGADTARIVIPDKEDKVSEIMINIPKSALKQLNDGKLKLEIATANAVISIPTASIADFKDDLYFRIIPLKSADEQKKVEERAKAEKLIKDIMKNETIQVLGRPMEIETNMQGREVNIVLPLKDSLSTDPVKRQKILDNLGIFIEHSDGTKELVDSKITENTDGTRNVAFQIDKFSTFTMVYLDGAKQYFLQQEELNSNQDDNNPVIFTDIAGNGLRSYIEQSAKAGIVSGYTDGTFRPNQNLTRAQAASIIVRVLNLKTDEVAPFGDIANYADKTKAEINAAYKYGIVKGSNGAFKPSAAVTRAQLALMLERAYEHIAGVPYKASQQIAFSDLGAYDAEAVNAISMLAELNIANGFEGKFMPNNSTTRAQAAKMFVNFIAISQQEK